MSDLRTDITALEASLAGLHDRVSTTALAAYASPDDADLRREADQALASLRDATDRLQQLEAALVLAERQEQELAEQQHSAERQKARDRLIRERDRLQHLADIEAEKWAAADKAAAEARTAIDEMGRLIDDAARLTGSRPDVEQIQAARATLAALERQLDHWTVTRDVEFEKRANASDHSLEYQEEADAITVRLDADLLTDDDVAANVAALSAEKQRSLADEVARQDAARLAEMVAESDRQIKELYENERIDVEPTRVLNGVTGNGWRVDRGLVVAVPRRDLDRLEAERRKYLDAEAARAAASAAEAEARRIRDEERAADYLAQFTKMQQTAAEWARSSGQRNAEQAA